MRCVFLGLRSWACVGRVSWCGMGEDKLGRTRLVRGEISWGEKARRVLTGECGGIGGWSQVWKKNFRKLSVISCRSKIKIIIKIGGNWQIKFKWIKSSFSKWRVRFFENKREQT
ncbi:hypothetical protein BM1374166_01865 [Bartonella tribocorum]|nr:hypothetical protein BM1374166_01865 [Bartonella tribocorum]